MDRRRRRARRIRSGVTALGGCLIAATVQLATHAPAQAAGAYGATANAAGFLTTTQDPQHFPVGAVIEGDGPIAQAALSSTGQSTGFASFPYPGAFMLSLQGLAASQGAPETPEYPLYVASDASIKPKAELKQPGLDLTSQSSPDASSSQAAAGGNSEQARVGSAVARTNVSADKSAGTVNSEASADTQMLSAGPLRIGRILSSAQATHSSSGGLKRTSSLQLFDVTVNGVTYGFTDKGFSSGASSSPLPANPAAEQLAKAGITVTYLAAREVPDGILSPGLRIQFDNEQSDWHTVMVVGQALAVASGDASSAGLLGGGILNGGFNAGSFGGTTSGSRSGTSSASEPSSAAGSTLSAGGGGGYASGASTGGTTPSTSSGTSSAPAPATGTPLSARPVAAGSAPGTSFYLLLVVGAVGALVVGQLISLVGVRWAR